MRFVATSLADAFRVETAAHADDRGHFARLRCSREFAAHGLPGRFVQTDLSYNRARGTFRGLHYQVPPSLEGKLVRCIAGALDDVIVDLRPGSPTFLAHEWFELTAANMVAVFVPPGFAHGFLTREADTAVLYEMTDYYEPELGRGLRWSDPAFALDPPGEIHVIAPRDADYPDLDVASLECFRVDNEQ